MIELFKLEVGGALLHKSEVDKFRLTCEIRFVRWAYEFSKDIYLSANYLLINVILADNINKKGVSYAIFLSKVDKMTDKIIKITFSCAASE